MIRRFNIKDAKEASSLIKRTLYEINIKDYEKRFLEDEFIQFSEKDILKRVKENNCYVFEENYKILGIRGN